MRRQKSRNHVSEGTSNAAIEFTSSQYNEKIKFAAKGANNEREDATDDKGIKKDKADADDEKDTEISEKKNNSAVSKSPRSKSGNKKSNDDAAAAKKCESGEKADERKDGDKEIADEKQASGIPLGDIAKIEKYITSTRIEVLQTLHQICFEALGKTNLLKKSLRQFAGFDFDKDSNEFEKKLKETQKFELPKLRGVCEGLQLDKKGSKDAVSHRICEFLLAPNGSEEAADEEIGEEEGE